MDSLWLIPVTSTGCQNERSSSSPPPPPLAHTHILHTVRLFFSKDFFYCCYCTQVAITSKHRIASHIHASSGDWENSRQFAYNTSTDPAAINFTSIGWCIAGILVKCRTWTPFKNCLAVPLAPSPTHTHTQTSDTHTHTPHTHSRTHTHTHTHTHRAALLGHSCPKRGSKNKNRLRVLYPSISWTIPSSGDSCPSMIPSHREKLQPSLSQNKRSLKSLLSFFLRGRFGDLGGRGGGGGGVPQLYPKYNHSCQLHNRLPNIISASWKSQV